jgi:hypothetical protein
MVYKTLKLSPINPQFNSLSNEERPKARVLNLDEVEIYQNKQDFFIKSQMGELKLTAGDELLVDRVLFRVSFCEHAVIESSLFKQENDSFAFEKDDEFTTLKSVNKNHPLAFLFSNGEQDE